jgi:hypothetical protein
VRLEQAITVASETKCFCSSLKRTASSRGDGSGRSSARSTMRPRIDPGR